MKGSQLLTLCCVERKACVCVYLCYHNIETLQSGSLGDNVFQPVREHIAWTSVFEHCSSNMEVLRIVKHSVSIKEEMSCFI